MAKLPVVPRRARWNLEGIHEGGQVAGVDQDSAPAAAAADAVVLQAELLTPAVDQLRRYPRPCCRLAGS